MGMIIKGLLAMFWLIFVPIAAGATFFRKKKEFTLAQSFLTGYLFLLALAQILTLPMLYLKLPLHILTYSYGGCILLMALYGCVCLKQRLPDNIGNIRTSAVKFVRGHSLCFWLALILIALQLGTLVLTAHFDADDSFYIATATTDVYTDTIFSVNPFTGREYKSFPSRYVLSPFPVFLAVISSLSGGLHPAIMAHTIFPLVFVSMAYLVQYQYACKFWKNDKASRGVYLFFAVLLCTFSAYSVYNSGNFQMVRIWQGKGLLAGVMLPLLLYVCICVLWEKDGEHGWLSLVMGIVSCSFLSSMGILLAPVMVGVTAIISSIHDKTLSRGWKALLCCTPSVILGIVYLVIR